LTTTATATEIATTKVTTTAETTTKNNNSHYFCFVFISFPEVLSSTGTNRLLLTLI